MNGDAGNDTLSGGTGADVPTGGAGSDVFVFDAPLYTDVYAPASTGVDTLADFLPGTEKIQLDDDVFPALPTLAAGGFVTGNFVKGTAATTADHRIIYDGGSGALYYDPDGTNPTATACRSRSSSPRWAPGRCSRPRTSSSGDAPSAAWRAGKSRASRRAQPPNRRPNQPRSSVLRQPAYCRA